MESIRPFTTWISIAFLLSTCCLADEHHKRVPSGFTGVRGKKSIPDEAYSADLENSSSVEHVSSFIYLSNECKRKLNRNYDDSLPTRKWITRSVLRGEAKLNINFGRRTPYTQ